MIKLSRPRCPDPIALGRDYRSAVNKRALREASFSKCMYCEAKIDHVYFGDVEHIRPKRVFPHLEHDWGNLGYVCAVCNNSKRDQWNATHPCVDPYEEEPAKHLTAVGTLIWHKNGSVRGEITCRVLDLNRPALVERRLERLTNLHRAIDNAMRFPDQEMRRLLIAELKKEIGPQSEYSMAACSAMQNIADGA
jgi:hypothetical protein